MTDRMTDSREAYERGLQTLAAWLRFLEEKEQELKQQLEKARQAVSSAATPTRPEDWLDESPPRAAPSAPELEDVKARRRAVEDAGIPAAADDELPDWLKG